MNVWIPLWSQTVDSTLWEEPLEVRVLFLTMMMIKDPDHVVRCPFRVLCKKANMPLEMVRSALEVLLSPDTKSADKQEHDGRRLQEVEGGWYILNAERYLREMGLLTQRIRKNAWQKRKRAEAKGNKKPEKASAEYKERERRWLKADGAGDAAAAAAIEQEKVPGGAE